MNLWMKVPARPKGLASAQGNTQVLTRAKKLSFIHITSAFPYTYHHNDAVTQPDWEEPPTNQHASHAPGNPKHSLSSTLTPAFIDKASYKGVGGSYLPQAASGHEEIQSIPRGGYASHLTLVIWLPARQSSQTSKYSLLWLPKSVRFLRSRRDAEDDGTSWVSCPVIVVTGVSPHLGFFDLISL